MHQITVTSCLIIGIGLKYYLKYKIIKYQYVAIGTTLIASLLLNPSMFTPSKIRELFVSMVTVIISDY